MRKPSDSAGALAVALLSLLSVSSGCGAPSTTGASTGDPLAALAADSARIMAELRYLSSDSLEGRGTGTEGAARARAWLAGELADAGVRPVHGGFMERFAWRGNGAAQDVEGVNVVGVVPGTQPAGRTFVLSAHLDHLGVRDGVIYNGADDDASGSVALVALARALASAPLRHTLLVAAFDAEEVGLRGSRAFVAAPPVPLDSIALDLNLDMVARTNGVLWAAGAHQTPALRPLLERVAAEAPLDLRLGHDAPNAPEGDDWTHASDHGPFHDAGIPFVYLGVEDHPDYHRPTDDFGNIDPGEYMDALRTALLTLLTLDGALPLSPECDAMSAPAPGPRFRLPHPLVLLSGCVLLAAAGSWVLPAGEYDRKLDEVTGRTVVVAGTYHRVERTPVGPFAAVVALPRGMIDASEVVFLVFLIGGAFTVVDETGALRRAMGGLARALAGRDLLVIPVVSLFFAAGGVVENMQEEIIPLVPVLIVLTTRLGFTPLVAVSMCAGSAFVGSAFSPINPFQVQIAQKLAEVPLLSGSAFRIVFLVLALALWIGATMRWAARTRVEAREAEDDRSEALLGTDLVILSLVMVTFGAVVWGIMETGMGLQRAERGLLRDGDRRRRARRAGRGRHGRGLREGLPVDGLRRPPHRLRAGDLRRAPGRAHRRHHRARSVHPARGAPRARLRARHDRRADGDPRAGAERERPGGADDAGARAALRPPRDVPPDHGAGLPVRSGPLRPDHADERRAHGDPRRGGGALRGVDPLHRPPLARPRPPRRRLHRRGARGRDLTAWPPRPHPATRRTLAAGGLHRNVWVASATSFLTDVSSEMLQNVLPLFLANVLGVRTWAVGVVEGTAESTASLLKLWSGWLSDRLRARKWLAVGGYGISASSKPFYLLAATWPVVAAIRWADRVGKGVRTAPRDALLADSVRASRRGLAFGIHRAADTGGAVVGLALTIWVVHLTQGNALRLEAETFHRLVLWSLFPAFLAVATLAFGARDVPVGKGRGGPSLGLRGMGRGFVAFVVASGVFQIGNSSDAFLILRAQERGLGVSGLMWMLLAFNVVYTAVSVPAGSISDRIGRRWVVLGAWCVYAAVYLGFAVAGSATHVVLLFCAYGVYQGMVAGASKALVADLVEPERRGIAYGTYHAVIGLVSLPASLLAGLLWQGFAGWSGFGPAAPFAFGAVAAAVASVLLLTTVPAQRR